MLMGAFFSVWGADVTGHWTLGVLIGIASGARWGSSTPSSRHAPRRPDRRWHGDQLPRARHHRVPVHRIYGERGRRPGSRRSRRLARLPLRHPARRLGGFLGDAFAGTDLSDLGGASRSSSSRGSPSSRRRRGSASERRRAPPCGGHGRHQRLPHPLRRGDLSGARRGGRRVPRARVRELLRPEHDRRARVHRPRRPHLRELAAVRRRVACLLFGFSSALATSLQEYSLSVSTLFEALPYVLTLVAVAGRHRALDSAGCYRPAVRQAVAVASRGSGAAWGSVLAGLASGRDAPRRDLRDPLQRLLRAAPRRLRDSACEPARLLALVLARRARRSRALPRSDARARGRACGRVLGIVGLWPPRPVSLGRLRAARVRRVRD